MAKKKFYAVKCGRKTGIYENWDECKAQVNGFPDAQYKGFASRSDAEDYLGIREDSCDDSREDAVVEPTSEAYAYVDGSYNDDAKAYGYGAVVVIDGMEHILRGSATDAETGDNCGSMRNVAGEINGAKAAVELALEKGCKSLLIYHDYTGIAKWVDGRWTARNEYTRAYRDFMQSAQTLMNIRFEHVKGHTGVDGNERADRLAKEAVGLLPVNK